MTIVENDDIIERLVDEGKGLSLTEGSFCPVSDEEEPIKEKRHREPRQKPSISRLSKEAVEKLIRLAVASVGNYSTFVEWKNDADIVVGLYGLSENVASRIIEYPFTFDGYIRASTDDEFQDIIIHMFKNGGWLGRKDDLGRTKQQVELAMIARLSIIETSEYVNRTTWMTNDTGSIALRLDHFYHGNKIPRKVETTIIDANDLDIFFGQKRAARQLFGNPQKIDYLDKQRDATKERESYIRAMKKPVDKEFVESVVREFIGSLGGTYTVKTTWRRDTVWEWVNDPSPYTGGLKKEFYDVDVIDISIYDAKSLSFRPISKMSIPLTRKLLGSLRPSVKDDIVMMMKDGMKNDG